MHLRRFSGGHIATFVLTLFLLAAALHRWRSYTLRQLRQPDEPIQDSNKDTREKNLLVKLIEPIEDVATAAKSKSFEDMKHKVDTDAKRTAANNNKTAHAANPDAVPNPDVKKAKDDRKADLNRAKDDGQSDWNRLIEERKLEWNNTKEEEKQDLNIAKDDRKPDWNRINDDSKPVRNRTNDDRKPDWNRTKDDGKLDRNRVKDDRKQESNIYKLAERNRTTLLQQKLANKTTAARTIQRNEEHLNTSSNRSLLLDESIIKIAKKSASLNKNTVILSFIDEDSLPFAKNWLCNTYQIVSLKSVLFVTTSETVDHLLKKHWPNANVVVLDNIVKETSLEYKMTLTGRKMRTISTLLLAGINVLLFDVHSVWFKNPVTELNADTDSEFDIAVNLASKSHIHVHVGLIYLVATTPTRAVWKRLIYIYRTLNQAESAWLPMPSKDLTYMDKYYGTYLLHMVESRYAGITAKELPITSYTDDTWYMMPEAKRDRAHLVVMKYNLLQGTEETITRAKQRNYWFLNSAGGCDVDLVRKTISKSRNL